MDPILIGQLVKQLRACGAIPPAEKQSPEEGEITGSQPGKRKHTDTTTSAGLEVSSGEDELDKIQLVSGMINNILSGESVPEKQNLIVTQPAASFKSASIALGAAVPPKIKAKIWTDDYVNLAPLIQDTPEEDYPVAVKNTFGC